MSRSPPPGTPQRVTRSKSSQPPLNLDSVAMSSSTAPGPPVPAHNISTNPSSALDVSHPSNPFEVDFVIPFLIAVGRVDRATAQNEIRSSYEELLHALEGEGGLRVATRPGKGKKGDEQVWVFVGAGEEKVAELVDRERLLDQSHGLPPTRHPIPPAPATRLRLLYSLLTSPPLQHGLGITPSEGRWKRVKSIAALHDEEADRAWVERWTLGGDWRVGLLSDLDRKADVGLLGQHQPPPVLLYFNFLTTYTLSLLPLSFISTLFYFFTPADSYSPLYGIVLSLYATIFVAVWRIKERQLAVRWGTRGCESVAVSRLRPEYVASLGAGSQRAGQGEAVVDTIRAGNDLMRDVKVALSIPVIIACGVGLGIVLLGIFMLEAFVGQVWEGFGKEVVPLAPTVLFMLLVPQIIGAYNTLAKMLVKWEDHPTAVGAEKSLTGKTFAMNGIVAYLGLFLSAYIYVPFGAYIMTHVQRQMFAYQHRTEAISTGSVASTPEKAGLGLRTTGQEQKAIKAGRLKGQLFAYTVTNQVINAFLELGLPYIMRFVNDLRAGKITIKEAIEKRGQFDEPQGPARDEADVETRFMNKVERELALPEYSLFTDYAEMITQFGYVTVWSIVWPLAPIFALINNYVELRTDALKICKNVRRPVGDRVESIGSWLNTLSIISWIGAVTNATLVYLFRPSTTLHDQTPNPSLPPTGSPRLAQITSSYQLSGTWQTILPTLIPLAAVALAASHGFIVFRWLIEAVAERVLWRGSEEELEVNRLRANHSGQVDQQLSQLSQRQYDVSRLRGGFWNGGEEGAREIGRVVKAE